MAKRRKEEQRDEPTGESIFDHFAAVGRPLPNTPAKSVDTAELMAKIEGLERQIAAGAKGGAEYPMLDRSRGQGGGGGQQVTAADVKVDLKDMPDPATEMDAYNRELAIRVNAAVQAQAQAATDRLNQQWERRSATDKLWSGFREKHPEWAKYEPLVETVAKRVVSEADARGVDLQRYMFQNSELFYTDLDKALKASYGKLIADSDGEFEDEDEAGDDNRTSGLSGQPSTSTAGKKQAKQVPTMLEDLGKIQRSMGIY